jgi:hypothetical protein
VFGFRQKGKVKKVKAALFYLICDVGSSEKDDGHNNMKLPSFAFN